jgi:Protein of unknown function (DUF742)
MGAGDKWIDRDAGPVVRPYAVTLGRTEPADGEVLDLIAVVVATRPSVTPAPSLARGGDDAGDATVLSPEHRRILKLCRRPVTVADVAADTSLPIGVVRVLLADLTQHGLINVVPQRPADEQPSAELLREVLHGLRAL